MSDRDDRERELQRREEELRQREHAIRLRELEDEINNTASYSQTRKHREPDGKLARWSQGLVRVGKFLGIVAAVIVTMKIAYWLSAIVLIGAVSWVAYKIFMESDRPNYK